MNAPTTFAHPDYIRLFGMNPPEQAIRPVDPISLRDDGNLGPPHHLFRDPNEGAAGHFSFPQPDGALADIAALRTRHIAKGHTPESDAAHGWVHFKRLSDDAFRDAIGARSRDKRRKCLIIAAAILVALIDAEDFTTRQKDSTDAPDE